MCQVAIYVQPSRSSGNSRPLFAHSRPAGRPAGRLLVALRHRRFLQQQQLSRCTAAAVHCQPPGYMEHPGLSYKNKYTTVCLGFLHTQCAVLALPKTKNQRPWQRSRVATPSFCGIRLQPLSSKYSAVSRFVGFLSLIHRNSFNSFSLLRGGGLIFPSICHK